MQELVVIAAGLLLGAAAAPLPSRTARVLVIVVGAIVIGTLWSRIVGEAEVLALWDSAQALAAAFVALALVRMKAPSRSKVSP